MKMRDPSSLVAEDKNEESEAQKQRFTEIHRVKSKMSSRFWAGSSCKEDRRPYADW